MNLTVIIIHTLLLFGLKQNSESATRNAKAEKHFHAKEVIITNVTPQTSRKVMVVGIVDTSLPIRADTTGATGVAKNKPQN